MPDVRPPRHPPHRRRASVGLIVVALAVGLLLPALLRAAGVRGVAPDRPENPAGPGSPGVLAGAHEEPPPPPDGEAPTLSHVHCANGFAGPYPCWNVDLLATVPRTALGAAAGENLNDVWGWTDPATGREYALVGLEGGTAFVDLGDPEHPVVLGKLPTRTFSSAWRDIKTYRNHAYVVADASPDHGMQVFDLTQLRGAGGGAVTFRPTAEYHGPGFGLSFGFALGSSHNLAIDEETGFAYAVGSDTCAGGLHMIDVRDPVRLRFAGCFADDGYTHDAHCVVYRGPDGRFSGREICFNSNEDTVTIVDVSDKRRPAMISRTSYQGSTYTHQAWLTGDHRHLLVNDELDELRFGHGSRTYVWDVANLDQPALIGTYTGPSSATDHNLYVHGRHVFESNYRSGLRILDLGQVALGRLREVAYFDVDPASDAPGFAGAWSVYPFFASGVVVVSAIGSGLFVLRPFPDSEHAGGPGGRLPPDLPGDPRGVGDPDGPRRRPGRTD